jgi:hypothetical protein
MQKNTAEIGIKNFSAFALVFRVIAEHNIALIKTLANKHLTINHSIGLICTSSCRNRCRQLLYGF